MRVSVKATESVTPAKLLGANCAPTPKIVSLGSFCRPYISTICMMSANTLAIRFSNTSACLLVVRSDPSQSRREMEQPLQDTSRRHVEDLASERRPYLEKSHVPF